MTNRFSNQFLFDQSFPIDGSRKPVEPDPIIEEAPESELPETVVLEKGYVVVNMDEANEVSEAFFITNDLELLHICMDEFGKRFTRELNMKSIEVTGYRFKQAHREWIQVDSFKLLGEIINSDIAA